MNLRGKNNTILPTVNMLSNGATIDGNISTEKDLRIDGIINGDVNCGGKLIVGSTAILTGKIECSEIEISGKIVGSILAKKIAVFKDTAIFTGDIISGDMVVESGATLEMTCEMKKEVTTTTSTTVAPTTTSTTTVSPKSKFNETDKKD